MGVISTCTIQIDVLDEILVELLEFVNVSFRLRDLHHFDLPYLPYLPNSPYIKKSYVYNAKAILNVYESYASLESFPIPRYASVPPHSDRNPLRDVNSSLSDW